MKQFKDPIYGYVDIASDIASGIVDTANFQRLRNIRQTSYAPLFPASVHNRFIHSMGVYHLGKLAVLPAIESIRKLQEDGEIFSSLGLSRLQELFELACLLHDVGHAPFSHTTEAFYKRGRSRFLLGEDVPYSISKHLVKLVAAPDFRDSFPEAAEHEIMSCIVALSIYGDKFDNDDDRSFFCRCILGYRYELIKSDEHDSDQAVALLNIQNKLKNCIISLLNAQAIDVDRLDYIIRDAETTGYQTASLDYKRLLNGIRIIPINGGEDYQVGFHKSAISVIESAIFAHDSERKWIQNHPVIAYECFLIERALEHVDASINDERDAAAGTLFSFDSLTCSGHNLGFGDISLLGDEDVLYLMKNVYKSTFSEEYFSRQDRRRPLWKSEAEFNALFSGSDGRELTTAFSLLCTASRDLKCWTLDDTFKNAILKRISTLESSEKSPITARSLKTTKLILFWLNELFSVADVHGVPRDFVIIPSSAFVSSFNKSKLNKIRIEFPRLKRSEELGDILVTLKADEAQDNYFYLFGQQKRLLGRQDDWDEKSVLIANHLKVKISQAPR